MKKFGLVAFVAFTAGSGILFDAPAANAQQERWSRCGTEGGYCQLPTRDPIIIRYGKEGAGVYTVHSGLPFIPCDNHLGDFNYGQEKVCDYRSTSAGESPPQSGYSNCARWDQECSFSSGGALHWMRFGNPQANPERWSYALVSGNFPCHWSVAGDSLKDAGLEAVCQTGPAYPGVTRDTTWTECASEGQECRLVGGGSPTKLVRYGTGDRYAYKMVDTGGKELNFPCTNQVFARDPAHGSTKFCGYAEAIAGGPAAIQSVRGYWFPVSSCQGVGCVAQRTETVGVEKTHTTGSTDEWSTSIMIGIEQKLGDSLVTGGETTLKSEITTTFGGSKSVEEALSRSSTGENRLTCGPTPDNRLLTRLYQYRIEVNESCAARGTCGSTIFTSEVMCVTDPPDPNYAPVCQPGCCTDDLCSTCKETAVCQKKVHPEFAGLKRS